MPGLLNLPTELMPMVVDSMDRSSLCQVRLTCKELQEHTWQQFGKQHFTEICILPTRGSLNRLEAISKHPRLQNVVESLSICSSIFRFSYYDDQDLSREDNNKYSPADHYYKKNTLPFRRPSKAWKACANESVCWMKSEDEEGFQEQLTRVLGNMLLFTLDVLDSSPKLDPGSAFTTDGYVVLRRTEILEDTRQDPLQQTQQNHVWDYADGNLHTIVCKKVLCALANSSQFPTSLHLNDVQAEHLSFEQITHRDLVEAFEDVGCLWLTTGFHARESQTNINPVPFINFLSAFSNLETQFLDMNYGSPTIHNRIWHSLRMPCLEVVGTSYINDEDLPGMSSFISRCSATLRDVSMRMIICDDDERTPWQLLVKKLEVDLTLEEINITVNDRKFEAIGAINVTSSLRELYRWIVECPLWDE